MLLLDEPFGMLDSLTRMELQQALLDILESHKITTLMVTHDVDEALLVSDRVVMMTTGPRARIGDILTVPFPRPRNRDAVLEHSDYYELRGRLIQFLEDQDHRRPGSTSKERTVPADRSHVDTIDTSPSHQPPAPADAVHRPHVEPTTFIPKPDAPTEKSASPVAAMG
jgi:nitrate/nitrite transport system ATP-binding protein